MECFRLFIYVWLSLLIDKKKQKKKQISFSIALLSTLLKFLSQFRFHYSLDLAQSWRKQKKIIKKKRFFFYHLPWTNFDVSRRLTEPREYTRRIFFSFFFFNVLVDLFRSTAAPCYFTNNAVCCLKQRDPFLSLVLSLLIFRSCTHLNYDWWNGSVNSCFESFSFRYFFSVHFCCARFFLILSEKTSVFSIRESAKKSGS